MTNAFKYELKCKWQICPLTATSLSSQFSEIVKATTYMLEHFRQEFFQKNSMWNKYFF